VSYYNEDPEKGRRFFVHRLDEPRARMQKLSRVTLQRDAEFVNDFFDAGFVYDAIRDAVHSRGYLSEYPDGPVKQKVIALLEKHSLWDGRDLTPGNIHGMAALAAELRGTAAAGQRYLDHELQALFYGKTLIFCIEQRNQMAEAFDALGSKR
jgi:hypothetical protein